MELPHYRQLVENGWARGPDRNSDDRHGLEEVIEEVATAAGRQLWFLAIVGGSAWKIEAALTRFLIERLPHLLGQGRPLPRRDTDPAAAAARPGRNPTGARRVQHRLVLGHRRRDPRIPTERTAGTQ